MKGLVIFIALTIVLILILLIYIFDLLNEEDNLRYELKGLEVKNKELQRRINTLQIYVSSYENQQKSKKILDTDHESISSK